MIFSFSSANVAPHRTLEDAHRAAFSGTCAGVLLGISEDCSCSLTGGVPFHNGYSRLVGNHAEDEHDNAATECFAVTFRTPSKDKEHA